MPPSNHSPSLNSKFLCLWVLFAVALSVRGEITTSSADIVISTWKIADGLPSDRVRHIVQTREGYLWVATAGGLARFDGVTFRVFNVGNSPELPDNLVNRLFEDRAGRLWIGHSTGEISRLDAGGFHRVKTEGAWLGVPVYRFAEAADGTLWVLNRKGWLCALQGDEAGEIHRRSEDSQAVDIVSDLEGRIWLADADSVEPWNGTDEAPTNVAESLTDLTLPRIASGRAGGVWVFEKNRIRLWREGKWREERISTLAPIGATALLETKSGALVRGSFRSGLEIIPPVGESQLLSIGEGLPSDWIRCGWEDREGSLWLGLGSSGLSRLRPRHVRMIDPPDSWSDRGVLTVSPAKEGGLWLGIEGPGLFRYTAGPRAELFAVDPESRMVAHAVLQDRSSQVWIGTTGATTQIWRRGRFDTLSDHPALVRTSALWEAADGAVWLGTYAGPAMWRDGKLSWPAKEAGVEVLNVRSIGEDSEGGIWLGTIGGGLARYHDGAFKIWRERDGLGSDSIWSIHVESDDTVWAGSYGKGLSRLQNGRVATVSKTNGLPSDVIYSILSDATGALWMSSDVGIFKVDAAQLHACANGEIAKISCLVLDRGDGLTTTDMTGGGQPVACRTPDGDMWFATGAGLAHVIPRTVRESLVPPEVGIENIRVNGEVVREARIAVEESLHRSLIVPPGAGSVEIDYTAFGMVSPNRIHFRYKLEGLDENWIEAGPRRTAFYNHVPAGVYRFRVAAGYDGANWNQQEAELPVIFEPYFWQTRWFQVGVGLFLSGCVGGAVYLITRHRHRRALAELRHARAIERERARIAHDIHDDLGAGLTQISLLTSSVRIAGGDPATVERRIGQIEASVTEMTQSMDEIVWAVNPGNDTFESLASYLGLFARDFLQAANVKCVLDLPIELPQWPISAEVRHGVYLCVKEALNNVLKHSGATVVRFRIIPEPDRVRFELADNGQGLSQPSAGKGGATRRIASGVGLDGMKRRLTDLGGIIEWEEPVAGGTIVRFVLPRQPVSFVESI